MSVRTSATEHAPAAPIVSISGVAADACATCWWHGRVHHDGH